MAVFDRIGAEVTFVYSRTFIDEAPMVVVSGTHRRSSSEPAPRTRLDAAFDAMTEEETLRGYVQSLGTSRTHRSVADAGEKVVAHREVAFAEPASRAEASCGSRGHPDLCKRPCIYFVAGKCTTGEQCNYCHMPHGDRPAKLDKQQRQKFNLMGMREALLMLHRILTSNAAMNGFLPLAKESLDLVAEEAMKHPTGEETTSESAQRRLERVLVRMPFHQLALLCVSKALANRSDFGELMVACIEKLTDDLEAYRGLGKSI
ncbi:strG [Symbiodinium sp. KB8]|nr:strG [Symbiodinium sp. KB8]